MPKDILIPFQLVLTRHPRESLIKIIWFLCCCDTTELVF